MGFREIKAKTVASHRIAWSGTVFLFRLGEKVPLGALDAAGSFDLASAIDHFEQGNFTVMEIAVVTNISSVLAEAIAVTRCTDGHLHCYQFILD